MKRKVRVKPSVEKIDYRTLYEQERVRFIQMRDRANEVYLTSERWVDSTHAKAKELGRLVIEFAKAPHVDSHRDAMVKAAEELGALDTKSVKHAQALLHGHIQLGTFNNLQKTSICQHLH